jgi:hypothetical protein
VRVFYDTEFIDDGRTIDLISIGAIDDAGREFYRVVADANWSAASRHPFVREHVLPQLPGGWVSERHRLWHPDLDAPEMAMHDEIGDEFLTWVMEGVPSGETYDDVRLWAYYSAYDHVALAQLYGPMAQMPNVLPFWTGDLRQRMDDLGISKEALPVQDKGHHNALDDARWNREVARVVEDFNRARLGV